jgi:glycosyltransferase involved in cell wall biosynthesis
MIPPYRYPVFKGIAADKRWRFRFLVSSPPDHTDAQAWRDLEIEHVAALHVRRQTHHRNSGALQEEPVPLPVTLIWQLLRYRPSIIVSGDMGIRSLMCWLVAAMIRAKLIIWSEDIASSAASRSRLQKALRRLLVRRTSCFVALGHPAADYLHQLGVKRDKIFVGAQAVENEHWLHQASEKSVDAERMRLGLQGVVFLTVSRLVKRKGIHHLLAAAAQLHREQLRPTFVIVGDGEERPKLEEYRNAQGLTNVLFIGHRPREELAQWYAVANALIFPTLEDVWGMVVNEALCSGLYVLGSKYAGACQQLLVSHPELGHCIDPSNFEQLVGALRLLTTRPPSRNFRRADAIRDLTFATSERAITSALETVQCRKRIGRGSTQSP